MPRKSRKQGAVDGLFIKLPLLCKLGSIAVHTDEMLSAQGHHFDITSLKGLLADTEVVDWIKTMGAYLPKKR